MRRFVADVKLLNFLSNNSLLLWILGGARYLYYYESLAANEEVQPWGCYTATDCSHHPFKLHIDILCMSTVQTHRSKIVSSTVDQGQGCGIVPSRRSSNLLHDVNLVLALAAIFWRWLLSVKGQLRVTFRYCNLYYNLSLKHYQL